METLNGIELSLVSGGSSSGFTTAVGGFAYEFGKIGAAAGAGVGAVAGAAGGPVGALGGAAIGAAAGAAGGAIAGGLFGGALWFGMTQM